jgi:hypothetical protein
LAAQDSFGKVEAYPLDSSGRPVAATGQGLSTGLTGAEGAVIDPLIGDFLFSTFGGQDTIEVVSEFTPVETRPAATSFGMLGLGLLGLCGRARGVRQ